MRVVWALSEHLRTLVDTSPHAEGKNIKIIATEAAFHRLSNIAETMHTKFKRCDSADHDVSKATRGRRPEIEKFARSV